MGRGSSMVEQLIRNQQAVGSKPTSGSILFFLLFFFLFYPSIATAQIGGSYQRVYSGAAFVSIGPVLKIPDKLSLSLKGGFVFSRRVIMELALGLGNYPYSGDSYYLGTRMFYRALISRKAIPGLNLIIGANNRNKVGIDMGLQVTKKVDVIALYFAVLDRGIVSPDNSFLSDFMVVPGVEVAISRVTFLSIEAGWSYTSNLVYISPVFSFAIY